MCPARRLGALNEDDEDENEDEDEDEKQGCLLWLQAASSRRTLPIYERRAVG